MLVPIHPADGEGLATWAMIELQGEIERKDGGKKSDAFDVGVLSLNPEGNLILTIGYHQLEGKSQQLKKPLAILNKIEDTDTMDVDGSSSDTEYKVIGVIREKYLFKTRPHAIISKPEKK